MSTEEKSIQIIDFLGKKSEWESWEEKICHEIIRSRLMQQ